MALTAEQLKKLNADFGTYSPMADSGKSEFDAIVDSVSFEKPKKEKGFFGDVTSAFSNIGESASKRMDTVSDINKDLQSGEQGLARSAGQLFGQGAGLASDVIGNVIMGGVKQLTPEAIQQPIGEAVTGAVKAVVDTEPVQKLVSWYSNLDPQKKRDLDAVLGTASLATDVIGGAVAKPAGQAVVKATGRAVDKVVDVAKPIIDTTKRTVTGLKNVTGQTVENLSQIPQRIATNVADRQATKEAIRALPTKVAQRSVLNGVDLNDAKILATKIKPEQKTLVKKLVDTARDFEKGGKTDPIEIVGKPIVQRLKTLEKDAGIIGNRLGKVADDLGEVSIKETLKPVVTELQKVQGLKGLKVGKNGKLDFTNTTLATAETSADRKAIQSIFNSAIKSGTGKQKHLLRQELFESLGGKKKSLANITGTQEKAYEAIRKALSDVLDSKNTKYKSLNKEYARVIRPISDMRKLMRVSGEADDIMDMSAGLLARRLTSNAGSRVQVKAILRAMDNAVGKKGTSLANVENLQDVYNILDKYYNITGKTTLQGQTASALEKASGGLTERVMQTVGEFAGQTEAVRRKAIEDLLDDLLK